MKKYVKAYAYKIKHKYVKLQKDGHILIEKYGFLKGTIENDPEIVYAQTLHLNKDSFLVKGMLHKIEQFYTNATTKEREEDFKEYEFKEILTEKQERAYQIIPSEELLEELGTCQLVFSFNDYYRNTLFINAADGIGYFSTDVLDICCKELIDTLLKDKVIYKARIRGEQ